MTFRFYCDRCGETHEGIPSFDDTAPFTYYTVAEQERETRCDLGTEDCIIDDKYFFVFGCLEIPVHGYDEPFRWGVWASLSETSYTKWVDCFEAEKRSHIGPFFGWLNAKLKPYPDTLNLKTMVHLRDGLLRPYIEVEPTDHPLAIEQRQGISAERVAEIYSIMTHGIKPLAPNTQFYS